MATLARTSVRDALDSAVIAFTAAGVRHAAARRRGAARRGDGGRPGGVDRRPAAAGSRRGGRRLPRLRAPPHAARAGRVHPRPQGLPAAGAGGRLAGADPAAGDRARRRGGADAARGRAGCRCRHRVGSDRARAGRRAAGPASRRRPTSATTRWSSRARTPRGSASPSSSSRPISWRASLGRSTRSYPTRRTCARASGWRRSCPSYEPDIALYGGGDDGLEIYRRLVPAVAGIPFVAFEIAGWQAEAVGALLRATRSRCYRDLAGIDRVVVGRL